MTGQRDSAQQDIDRVLATVRFTDIVDSTRRATETGYRAWRRLLDSHDELASLMVEQHRGILIKSTGDGILATFDGPARGVRCALASEQLQNRSACPFAPVSTPVKSSSGGAISVVWLCMRLRAS
ncbi:hypothetical protein [Bradyrhizobium genosp. SA-3]|uniref:hypothetical protein n=1 Tax=Bradyrhizobium genosp. SA-3 TaxID=508868 RepID=UPI001028E018|nr:hypothetical protein [Bradyrhizobium genosp. SA-3]